MGFKRRTTILKTEIMYQKLFDHLNKEFDILATDEDMEMICNIVKEIEQAKLDQARKERKHNLTVPYFLI